MNLRSIGLEQGACGRRYLDCLADGPDLKLRVHTGHIIRNHLNARGLEALESLLADINLVRTLGHGRDRIGAAIVGLSGTMVVCLDIDDLYSRTGNNSAASVRNRPYHGAEQYLSPHRNRNEGQQTNGKGTRPNDTSSFPAADHVGHRSIASQE